MMVIFIPILWHCGCPATWEDGAGIIHETVFYRARTTIREPTAGKAGRRAARGVKFNGHPGNQIKIVCCVDCLAKVEALITQLKTVTPTLEARTRSIVLP